MKAVALLWEHVEELLPPNTIDEAQMLVGKDLIEQNFELKTELNSFLDVMKDGAYICKQVFFDFPRVPTILQDIHAKASDFVCVYLKDTYSQNETSDLTEPRYGVPRLDEAVVKLRENLKDEANVLKNYICELQTALLDNLTVTPNQTGDWNKYNCQREHGPGGVFENGDTESSPGRTSIIRQSTTNSASGSLCGRASNFQPLSSISDTSVGQCTSVSPHPPVKLDVHFSLTSIGKRSHTEHKMQLFRSAERLSPSSKLLSKNHSDLLPRKMAGGLIRQTGKHRTPPNSFDDKTAPWLPPLHGSRGKPQRKNDVGDRSWRKTSALEPVSTNASKPSFRDQSHSNSAQRFRQMVLHARKGFATFRNTNGTSNKTGD